MEIPLLRAAQLCVQWCFRGLVLQRSPNLQCHVSLLLDGICSGDELLTLQCHPKLWSQVSPTRDGISLKAELP